MLGKERCASKLFGIPQFETFQWTHPHKKRKEGFHTQATNNLGLNFSYFEGIDVRHKKRKIKGVCTSEIPSHQFIKGSRWLPKCIYLVI